MDHTDQQHARKNEPSLDPSDAFSTAPVAAAAPQQPPVPQAGDMPAWLANQSAPSSAAQRWGRRLMFLGAAVLAVALAGGATMLGLDLYESNASMEVVASSSQGSPVQPAPSGTLPYVEKRPSSVPPLVLLPPDANAKKDAAAPVAAEAAVKEAVAVDAAVPESAPTEAKVTAPAVSAVNKTPVAAVPAKPVVAAPVKPAATAPVQSPANAIAAKPVSRPKPAAAKKTATVAKRPAKPVLARAKPARPIKGTMLQPPRDRSDERARDDDRPAPRQAIDRRCRPGELARECEARTR